MKVDCVPLLLEEGVTNVPNLKPYIKKNIYIKMQSEKAL